jgi:hypothetical protein
MRCPEPDQLASLLGGQLAASERDTLTSHLDDCDDCRSAVALLAKLGPADAPPPSLAETMPAPPAPPSSLADTLLAPPSDGSPVDPMARTTASGEIVRPSSRDLGLAAGATFDRYVVTGRIGRGGMGVVYAARDPKLGRDIAIKVLRPELARNNPELARRVTHEARVMARISHPNVLGVFDVGTVGDQVYIAMELVTGTSLRGWLDAAPRSIAEIVEAFVVAGRGLVAAHDAGVVHRDFKPDNVLVGADGRIRVTDFGLALERDDHDDAAGSGTPGYMAPEQFEGGTVDGRTDQFAFCVALYQALYKRRPFIGGSYDELRAAVATGAVRPPPPGSRVPASLHAIVVRGLAVTPGDRFPTLADLLKALGRDRGRRPRQLAVVATAALAVVGVGFGADGVVRAQVRAVTGASFDSTRAYVAREIAQRTNTFVWQSDALYSTHTLQRITGTVDQADFGLGDATDDRKLLLESREALKSATWVDLVHKGADDVFAIADRKGRLLYTSLDPEVWDRSILTVPAIAAAYTAAADTTVALVRADDPQVVAAGILPGVRTGLFAMFARVKFENDVAKAAFVRLDPASDVLRDVVVAKDPIALSIVATDHSSEGTVPPAILAASAAIDNPDTTTEIVDDNVRWLVQRFPLVPGAASDLVLAKRADVGLAGLFPRARLVLAVLAFALVGAAAGGWLVARRRDLARR